jgi:pyruvate/2-oxoglutarate dehydrogenase complex dihydrolipoamide acyltransferase (E2) component
MTEGKILEWKIKVGDSFDVGDSLFSIETDKATVDY